MNATLPIRADQQGDPLDAGAILNGSLRPWCFDSRVATRADWLLAAQCALDGDERDLRLFWNELLELRGEEPLPADAAVMGLADALLKGMEP